MARDIKIQFGPAKYPATLKHWNNGAFMMQFPGATQTAFGHNVHDRRGRQRRQFRKRISGRFHTGERKEVMETWFTLRRISNHRIAQRRVACVMLSEAKHLWFVSAVLSKSIH